MAVTASSPIRVRYSLFAPAPRIPELEDFKSAAQMLHRMRFGDDMARGFNGIGENVTWGTDNNDNMSELRRKSNLYERRNGPRTRGMTLTIHWQNDPLGRISLLDVFERVNS